MTPQEYVAQLRSFEGVRWVHQGRSRHGVDCIGVLLLPLLEAGLVSNDIPRYPRVSNGGVLLSELQRHCRRVEWEERREGDILLMWWNRHTREPQHLAGLVRMDDGADGMLHAYMDAGKVVCNHLGRWRRRVISVWRPRGLEA